MDAEAGKFKILIVDDDEFLLKMYSLKFSERGFEVVTALNGEEALEKITGGFHPDIYLVDLLMPKVDGFQLIKGLKEKNLDQRSAIIILSNLGQQDEIAKGLELGVDGYIVKASTTPSEVVAKTVDMVKQQRT